DQRLVAFIGEKDEEIVVGAPRRLPTPALKTCHEDATRQVSLAPARLERPQEFTAVAAQIAPGRIVARLGTSEQHAGAAQHRRFVVRQERPDHVWTSVLEVMGDGVAVRELVDRADAGERNTVAGENLARHLLYPVGGDAIDPLHRLLQWDDTAPQDLLAGELAGARGRAFERHQQTGADLVADPNYLLIGDGLG